LALGGNEAGGGQGKREQRRLYTRQLFIVSHRHTHPARRPTGTAHGANRLCGIKHFRRYFAVPELPEQM
jgi:hypothetical protein